MPDTPRPAAHQPAPHTEPDMGAEALTLALSGSDGGSDTRAGSLRGGSASGSDIDPDQDRINAALAKQGQAAAADRDHDAG
ncbi:ribonuclease [uncultured Brevundimonas sp.]|uniref:ribonuclease n=1 Tax=uncultured Brevundimonas sp. TaxID=213418 RepID=UPI0030ED35C2|tara:strand:- start:1237 stop:1479 length:243 start_codon:yes stop_codon:yes gene_type:complete